ncbi:MAG: RNA polymerase sigma factor, partial [Candidatus Methylomirabilia bacterium]
MNIQVTRGGPEKLANLTSAAVFAQHRDRIYRYLLRLVRDPGEAEDLTQETFLRAHRQLESLQDRAALVVWLYRIATHVCYDRFRRSSSPRGQQQAAATPDEARWADVDAPRIDTVIEQTEMSACVQEFVEKLPDTYRAVILLHDLHGLSNPEIAQMLGHSLETVKIHLHRARRKLQ